jgi:hypothetical protein
MKKARRGLLIDANLLVLMIIGRVDDGHFIEGSDRLNAYCLEDYDNLWSFIKSYGEVWITPYIAAEVSNLIDLKGHARDDAFEIARLIFQEFKQVDTSIAKDCANRSFIEFGLTDASVIALSKDIDILTSDHRMSNMLSDNQILPYTPIKTLRNL